MAGQLLPRPVLPFHDRTSKLAQKPHFSDFWQRKGLFCSLITRLYIPFLLTHIVLFVRITCMLNWAQICELCNWIHILINYSVCRIASLHNIRGTDTRETRDSAGVTTGCRLAKKHTENAHCVQRCQGMSNCVQRCLGTLYVQRCLRTSEHLCRSV